MICNDLQLVAIVSFHSLQLESTQKAAKHYHELLFTKLSFVLCWCLASLSRTFTITYRLTTSLLTSLIFINNIQSLVTHLRMTVLVPNWNIAGWLPRPYHNGRCCRRTKWMVLASCKLRCFRSILGMHTNAYSKHTHTKYTCLTISVNQLTLPF